MDSQFLALISSSFGSFAISESLGRIMICLRQRNNFSDTLHCSHSLSLSLTRTILLSLSLSLTHKLSFTHGSPHTTEAQTLFFHRSFFNPPFCLSKSFFVTESPTLLTRSSASLSIVLFENHFFRLQSIFVWTRMKLPK